MRAVVIDKPGSIDIAEVPDPAPRADEVVIAVRSCGICGTDLHIVDGELPPTPYPIIPGHEFAGEIVAVGAEVTDLQAGDRVAVEPSLPCGHCDFCRDGRGNICATWVAIGVTEPGGSAEYAAIQGAKAYKIPDDMSWSAAALIEPLSCAVHGYDRLPRRLDSRYLIYGAGTMGLFMLQLAHGAGASSVEVVDTNAGRLDLAAQLGASATATNADALDRPGGWEVVIDATGVIAAIEDGLTRVRRGGTFLQFGVAPTEATARFSPYRVYNEEIDIIGSMAVINSYRRAVDLMAAGVIDAERMVSDAFPLSDYARAIDTFRAGTGRKLQILPKG